MNKGNKQEDQVIKNAKMVISGALGHVRSTTFFDKAPVAKKSAFESALIAATISHKLLDITVDPQGSIFYNSNLSPLTDQIIAAFNEVEVIDIDAVRDLVYPMWHIRFLMATGKVAPWEYVNFFHTYMPDPKATIVKELFEGLRGI